MHTEIEERVDKLEADKSAGQYRRAVNDI